MGKPSSLFFETALLCDPDSAVMIGDDFNDDCLGAEKCGIAGLLGRVIFLCFLLTSRFEISVFTIS